MKHEILSILFTGLLFPAAAQNLVPNPGFEDYNGCPMAGNTMSTSDIIFPLVDQWFKPTQGSTDYFNTCGDALFGIPENENGYEPSHNGNGYCGLIALTHNYNNYREYLEVKLSQPLQKDHLYCVQFYVSNASGFDSTGSVVTPQGLAVNGMGAYFSATLLSDLTGVGPVLNVQPQIINPPSHLLAEENGWELITGIYSAAGGEEYMTIGNFLNDATTDDSLIVPAFFLNSQAFYYVDDVSVTDMNISVNQLPDDTTLCDGETITLNATNPQASSYLWQDQSTNPVYTVHGPGIYKVQVVFDCGMLSDSVKVSYTGLPDVALRTDTTLCLGSSLELNAASNLPVSYLWNDGSTADHIMTSSPGTYSVQATNSCGVSSDSVTLTFIDCSCDLFVPNAFTPNNDGLNDVFLPVAACKYLQEYHLEIFNRWSQLIFESHDLNTGWSGNYMRHPAEMGAYIYFITYTAAVNTVVESKTMHGNLTLIR